MNINNEAISNLPLRTISNRPLRTCTYCGLKAYAGEELKKFVTHPHTKYGRQNVCKDCKRDYKRAWRRENEDRVRECKRRWKWRLKEKVISLYGGICSCCGESNIYFLTMDHIEGDGAEDRKELHRASDIWRKMITAYEEDRDKALRKYQVLCFNCNQGREVNGGICPHKALAAITDPKSREIVNNGLCPHKAMKGTPNTPFDG